MNISELTSTVVETMNDLIERDVISFTTPKQQNAFKQTLISQAIEGEILNEREIIDFKKRIDGEETNEEFIEKIKASYYDE